MKQNNIKHWRLKFTLTITGFWMMKLDGDYPSITFSLYDSGNNLQLSMTPEEKRNTVGYYNTSQNMVDNNVSSERCFGIAPLSISSHPPITQMKIFHIDVTTHFLT